MSGLQNYLIRSLVILVILAGCNSVTASNTQKTAPRDVPLEKQLTSTPTLDEPQATSTPSPTMAPTILPTEAATQPILTPLPVVSPSVVSDVTLLAAGDIADCNNEGDEETAKILAQYPDAAIAALGDNVYEEGTAQEFAECYQPTWGQFIDRTYPAVGNHEYSTPGAAPYYDYFGAAAGDADKGYYSYDLGNWHIIVLNSNCTKVGGCKPGNPQVRWLMQDLQDHSSTCSLAYWHHPRFSSGQWGNTEQMETIWGILYQNGVELVLSGHDHNYERFQPIGPDEVLDPEFGIRQFVVGTGGKNLGEILSNRPLPASEITDTTTYGVLKLNLRTDRYSWEYLPAEGGTFTDSGEAACHLLPGEASA